MSVSPPDISSCLLDILRTLPADRPLIRAGKVRLTAGDTVARAEALRLEPTAPAGQGTVLHALAPLELILHLIAWDGFSTQLLLLPGSLDTAMAQRLAALVAPPSGGSTEWLLATSGTTGTPKLIGHSLASLSRSLKRNPDAGSGYRWGLVYDPCRFAGLQVTLQALFSGSELVLTPPDDFEAQVSEMVEAQINALSATPTLWRKLAIDGRIAACPLRQITLGGEIADQKLLDHLRQRFPTARVIHIYASTEAGVGFAVTDGRAGFPVSYISEGSGRTRLRIDDAGCLWLRPEIPPPGAPRQDTDADGFINSHDRVELRENRIFFLGRDNGTINVGGNKVHPELVEGVLRELAEVMEARVVAKKSPFTGEIAVAEVVPDSPGDDQLRRVILDHCRNRLEPWQVPALVRFVDRIDTSPAGKLSRTGAGK
jgi:acyl-CoA synthetase (AMP-forming)/AMP-acid ligase II